MFRVLLQVILNISVSDNGIYQLLDSFVFTIVELNVKVVVEVYGTEVAETIAEN